MCAKYKLGPHHFSGSTGYGHGDEGRNVLDKVFTFEFISILGLILKNKATE